MSDTRPMGCRWHCNKCGRHFSSVAAHDEHRCGQDPRDNPRLTRVVGPTVCRLVNDFNDPPMWGLWNP